MACERGHTNLIAFTHVCGYYSRAATISLVKLQVRLLFEGGYYSGCGFYLNKYGITSIRQSLPFYNIIVVHTAESIVIMHWVHYRHCWYRHGYGSQQKALFGGMFLIKKWMKFSIQSHPKMDDYFITYEIIRFRMIRIDKYYYHPLLDVSFLDEICMTQVASIIGCLLSLSGWIFILS